MTRICITGGPVTGKTTLARKLVLDHACCRGTRFPYIDDGRRPSGCQYALHTDDLIEATKHLGKDAWSEMSRLASLWLDEPGPWVIEGVAVSRALRKWHAAHPGERAPVDRVILLATPFGNRSKGQIAMAKGVETVHAEIIPWLLDSGVEVVNQAAHQVRASNMSGTP